MYADADEHGPEREMILAPYFQVLQAIIVQDAVIYTFTRGTLAIYFLVLFGIPGDAGMETQVTMVLYINGAAVVSRGTRFRVRAGVDASAFERATVLACILDGVVSPGAHFMPRHAQRVSLLVKGDIPGGVWRGLRPAVDVNQRVDAPTVQQLVSRDVVMGRVEADVFRGEAGGVPPEVVNGVKEALAVVPPRLRELHRYREFDL